MELRVWLHLGAGLVVLACLPTAGAQYARTLEALTRHPTDLGPSQIIGGNYTGARNAPLESTRRNNAFLLDQRPLPFRSQPRRDQHTRMMPGLARGQMFGGSDGAGRGGFSGPEANAFRNQNAEIKVITGLTASMDLELPLPGVPIGYVPALSACEYTPRPATTRFQDLLGLVPSTPAPAAPPLGTSAERLEEHTAQLVAYAESDALTLFKQATVDIRDARTGRFENCADCADKLSRAVQRLRMVNDLTPASGLAALLMAHVALERERPLQAMNEILEALQREPGVLSDAAGPFARYFGDADADGRTSAFLEAQMRRYFRIGEYNRDSVAAQALQAYCAWRLGETDAMRAALNQVETLSRSKPEEGSEELLSFAAALRATLR